MIKSKNKEFGITLIALIITIIVLLILAGVTIVTITGNHSLISQTQEGKDTAERAEILELIRADIFEKNIQKATASGPYKGIILTEDELKQILEKYGIVEYEEDKMTIAGVTTKKGNYYLTRNEIIDNMDEYDNYDNYDEKIYAKLYEDNDGYILVLSNNENDNSYSSKSTDYGNIANENYYYDRDNSASCYANFYYDHDREISYDEFSSIKDYNYLAPWYAKRNKIKNVKIANEIKPKNTASWFQGLENLETIENIENIDTSKVTDMSYMFSYTGLKRLSLSSFDTSNVTNMRYMFANVYDDEKSLEYLNVSSFKTSKVTDMSHMFKFCDCKSLDISNWDTSQVVDMNHMFQACYSLTQLDLNKWNTSNVTDMSYMFSSGYYGKALSLNIDKWDISNVKNMSYMFYDSPIKELDLSGWKDSSVTDMSSMFEDSRITKLKMNNLDTSNVTNMRRLFEHTSDLVDIDISRWNTSNVEDMTSMFDDNNRGGARLTELDISGWNTSKVKSMNSMFYYRKNLIKIYVGSGWTTNNADTRYMFDNCGTQSVTRK